jgi:predicted secreted Zn-dependent protease
MADWSEAIWRRSTRCANGSCVEVAVAGGHVAMRDSKIRNGPLLQFDRESWEDFLAGVRRGEFDLASQIRPDDGHRLR